MSARQSNASLPGYETEVPGVIEMAALEDLGPRTIFTLKNMPLPMLAAGVISQIVEFNDKIEAENRRRVDEQLDLPQLPYLDPKDPQVDRRIAQSLVAQCATHLRRDNVLEVDVQKAFLPLTGKPSPKSIREQRRAMRSSRWLTSARSQTR